METDLSNNFRCEIQLDHPRLLLAACGFIQFHRYFYGGQWREGEGDLKYWKHFVLLRCSDTVFWEHLVGDQVVGLAIPSRKSKS